LERRIEQDLGFLTDEVRRLVPSRQLAALVLGGGYGRGDGGVRMTPKGPAPYNDYDFFAVLRDGSTRQRRSLCRAVAQRRGDWEAAVDLEVEVAVCTLAGLRRSPLTLRLFDLAGGHRVLWGDDSIGEVFERFRGRALSLVEGARLLVNRGSLLAYCKRAPAPRHELPEAEVSRLIRYLHKAILACGDVVLMRSGRYVTDSDERVARLRRTEGPSSSVMELLPSWYAYVVDSRRVGRQALPPGCDRLDECFEQVWRTFEEVHRWFEGERLRVDALRWSDYIRGPFNKFPRSHTLSPPSSNWKTRLLTGTKSLADRARHAAGQREFSRRITTLRYGRENVLAGWLADLLYLRGRPALATSHPMPDEVWNQQFLEYWTLWSQ
jgi:hypothetical protein